MPRENYWVRIMYAKNYNQQYERERYGIVIAVTNRLHAWPTEKYRMSFCLMEKKENTQLFQIEHDMNVVNNHRLYSLYRCCSAAFSHTNRNFNSLRK